MVPSGFDTTGTDGMTVEFDARVLNEQQGAWERIAPGMADHGDGTVEEHLARYRWVRAHMRDVSRVLDAACGTGYGRLVLTEDSWRRRIVSCDLSVPALEFGRDHYGLEPVVADVQRLPVRDGSFTVVVGLETVEHVPEPDRYLSEMARVLVPGGQMFLSTPNADVSVGGNPHHLEEFTGGELEALVWGAGFSIVRREGQHWHVNAEWPSKVKGARRAAWMLAKRPEIFRLPDVAAAPLYFCWELRRN
jgi:SAM-dependent methyltransferase